MPTFAERLTYALADSRLNERALIGSVYLGVQNQALFQPFEDFRRRALGRSLAGMLWRARRSMSGRRDEAVTHFSQYASAERRASSHVVRCPTGLRQPFGRLSPAAFQSHRSGSAS